MSEKILIINDDAELNAMVRYILSQNGYESCEALDGEEGIKLASEYNPDLILLDIIMPNIDGYEVCRRLKKRVSTRNIPIIIISSLNTFEKRIEGLECGAADFINNAINKQELLARIRTHLDIRKLTKSLAEAKFALEKELEAAASVQKAFLPKMSSESQHIEYASMWLPGKQIGGDIFNVIYENSENAIFYMIDVSGHDVTSALVSVSISQFLLQHLETTLALEPANLLETLNNAFPFSKFNRFFTITYFVLNYSTGELTYSSAGHTETILLPKTSPYTLLNEGGTFIGIMENSTFSQQSLMLNPGDLLFIYTDGVTETKNENEEHFGADRLCKLIESLKECSVQNIVEVVHNKLDSFSQNILRTDDISMLCLRYRTNKGSL